MSKPRASFVPYTNSETPYTIQIKRASGYGGYSPAPVQAQLQSYSTQIQVSAPGDSYYNNGYFYASPTGDYTLTYTLEVDGKQQERTEPFAFFEYPKQQQNQENTYENFGKKLLNQQVSQYVMNSNNMGLRSIIASKIDTYWPTLEKEVLVYRGQKDPFRQEITTEPETFFSTSLNSQVASLTFTSKKDKCCLFILHIQPGVKYYSLVGDINTAIQNLNEDRGSHFESEILIEGNGKFYQDREKTKPGFREIPMEELQARNINASLYGAKTHSKNGRTVEQQSGIFEAYYFPPETRNGGGRKKRRQTRRRKF